MLRSRSSRRSRRCSGHRRGNQPDRSLRGYTSGAARGAGWPGLPPFLETVRNRRPRSSFHALHESPPFDGLSTKSGRRDSLSSFRPLPQAKYSRPPAVERSETLSTRSVRTTPFAWRCLHSPAYTCIHAHFGDFTFTQLRSFLLIFLQLRLQVGSRSPCAFATKTRPAGTYTPSADTVEG